MTSGRMGFMKITGRGIKLLQYKVDEENILSIEIALEVATRMGMKLNCHNIFLGNLRNNLMPRPVCT